MAWYCSHCYGDGIVLATPKTGENAGLTYAFRCGCRVGEAKPQSAIPVFSGRTAQQFEVIQIKKAEQKQEPAPIEPADSLW